MQWHYLNFPFSFYLVYFGVGFSHYERNIIRQIYSFRETSVNPEQNAWR